MYAVTSNNLIVNIFRDVFSKYSLLYWFIEIYDKICMKVTLRNSAADSAVMPYDKKHPLDEAGNFLFK